MKPTYSNGEKNMKKEKQFNYAYGINKDVVSFVEEIVDKANKRNKK